VGFVYVDHILQYLLSNYPVWARIANPTKKAKANGRSSASCVRRRARCGSVPLLATGFDRRSAPALGLSPAFADAALLVLLAAAIVVAVQGLGNLLVVAVFVGPAAAARKVGRASVYRALEELGLVQRIEVCRGTAGYERIEPSGHHHHHAICRDCGRMAPFEDSSLERAIGQLSESISFDITEHDVVLRGRCERCAD
jgi:hypothetical protein